MAFNAKEDGEEVMSEINMTPLVDVMLVLLIIFIITVPVMNHSVHIELPKASNRPQDNKPQTIRLVVDAKGDYFWNDAAVSDTQVSRMLQIEASRNPQPELHIKGDRDARYERVAQLMAAAQRAGLQKIGFITQPDNSKQ
jgi:biopolymer transport protein ExbD